MRPQNRRVVRPQCGFRGRGQPVGVAFAQESGGIEHAEGRFRVPQRGVPGAGGIVEDVHVVRVGWPRVYSI